MIGALNFGQVAARIRNPLTVHDLRITIPRFVFAPKFRVGTCVGNQARTLASVTVSTGMSEFKSISWRVALNDRHHSTAADF
jgi:hypothetical protein